MSKAVAEQLGFFRKGCGAVINEVEPPAPAMTHKEILQNAETYKAQIYKILSREKTIIDFNSRWLGKLTSFEIIRLAAKHTVARLLERDDFSKRLKQGSPPIATES